MVERRSRPTNATLVATRTADNHAAFGVLPAKEGHERLDPIRQYYQDIGRTALLTAQQEIALGKDMARGMMALQALRSYNLQPQPTCPPFEAIVPQEDEMAYSSVPIHVARLIRDYEAGVAARDHLIRANLRLVVSIAAKHQRKPLELEDLIAEGNLGLIRAVEKYNYALGYRFSTYATWWIRQTISRAIADKTRTIRIPVNMGESIKRMEDTRMRLAQVLGRPPNRKELAEELGISIEKLRRWEEARNINAMESIETAINDGDDDSKDLALKDIIRGDEDPEKEGENGVLAAEVEKLFAEAGLSPREREVLRSHFGLGGRNQETLEKIGDQWKLTRERVRQIEIDALNKLREHENAEDLRAYWE